MSLAVKVTPNNVGALCAAKVSALRRATPQAVLAAANYAGGAIARAVYRLHGGGTSGLARSFLPASFVDIPGKIAAGAFSDEVQARILDEGGVIKAKGKNLAIHVDKRAKNKWPRGWPKDALFYMRGKSGKGLLCERIGKGQKIRVLYVLQPTVTIKGSGYIGIAAAEAQPKVEEILAMAVDAAVIR